MTTMVSTAGHLLSVAGCTGIIRTGSRLSIWGTCFIHTTASTPFTKPGRKYRSDFTKDEIGQGICSVSQAVGWPELPDSDYSGSRIFQLAYPSPVPCSTAPLPKTWIFSEQIPASSPDLKSSSVSTTTVLSWQEEPILSTQFTLLG